MLLCGSKVLAFPVAPTAWLGTNPCLVCCPGVKFSRCSSGAAEMGTVKRTVSGFAFAWQRHTGAACCEVLGVGITNPLQCGVLRCPTALNSAS